MSALLVVGCGLLGTSVARAYARSNPKANIVGVEPESVAREAASQLSVYTQVVPTIDDARRAIQTLGVIGSGSEDGSKNGGKDGSVIGIAATPVPHLAQTLLELASFCTLAMDVGSVKAPVVAELENNAPGAVPANIVPAHPMAGSHERGSSAATADLFDGRWVYIVPLKDGDPQAVKVAHQFWQTLGGHTQETDPQQHDQAVGYTSHLPHLLSSAYMEVQGAQPAAAGTGFMDFTRLAKANPQMWSQVLIANQHAWKPQLTRYIEVLQSAQSLLETGDVAAVERWLEARLNDREGIERAVQHGPATQTASRVMQTTTNQSENQPGNVGGVPVITIDGPSGSGKGTLARALAERLAWNLLDSGSLYRIVGWAAESRGVSLDNEQDLARLAESLDIAFDGEETWVDGVGAESHIRSEEAGAAASQVAAMPAVRQALDRVQKAMRKPPGLVADGRDMGTVVFTSAPLKIFLEASAEVRAERRYKQLKSKGSPANVRALLKAIRDRDERDKGRAVSPLVPAEDAVILDSTTMTIDAVIDRAFELVRERGLV